MSLILLSFSLSNGCREKQWGSDPAKQLVYQSIEAIGGVERATGWTTRMQEGTYKTTREGWGNLKARTARFLLKPDKVKIDNDFSAYDHPFYFTYYLNGDDAWQVVNLGVRQSQQLTDRMKDYVKKADGLSYFLTACDSLFLVSEIPEDSLLAAGSLKRVGCVSGEDTTFFDLDRTTHLLLRQIEIAEDRQTVFDDYRETQGLMVPYHVTVYRNGEKAEEFLWERITFNRKIDQTIFEEDMPASTP